MWNENGFKSRAILQQKSSQILNEHKIRVIGSTELIGAR